MGGGATLDEARAWSTRRSSWGSTCSTPPTSTRAARPRPSSAGCRKGVARTCWCRRRPGFRPGRAQPRREHAHHLTRQLDGSLRRLNTDYVDVFYRAFPGRLHGDRRDRREPSRTSSRAARSGISASANHAAWRIALSLGAADRLGYPPFVAYQGLWNLLARDAEDELVPLCRTGTSASWRGARSPADSSPGSTGGAGTAGRARMAEPGSTFFGSTNSRPTMSSRASMRSQRDTTRRRRQVSLAWLLAQPGLASVVVGARDRRAIRSERAGSRPRARTRRARARSTRCRPADATLAAWHLEWRSRGGQATRIGPSL